MIELKSKQPHFKIVNSGHKYYIYLKHGHRYTRYFGKVVENCLNSSGSSYTLVSLKFNKLAKLHFTKGINYFDGMDNNLRFKLQEKHWFKQFQKIVLLGVASYDSGEFAYADHKIRTHLVRSALRATKSARRLRSAALS